MKDKAKLQDQLQKSEEIIRQAERLLERSTGAELVRSKTVIEELFQGFQEPQGVASTIDRKSVTVFVQNEQISECLRELSIGQFASRKTETEANKCSVEGFQAATAGLETKFEVITRNSEGEQCYCLGDYIDVGITSVQGANVAAEIKIIDKNNGSYAISFIPSEAGQHILTVQVNGFAIRKFPPIDIKERSFKPVRFLGEGCINLKHPWGVAVNDSNEIFTTDLSNDRIVVLNENGKFIRSFGQGLVNEPTGICIDTKGRIFVASRGNNKILLFNCKGEYIRVVHNGDSLDEARGISLDEQGNLIVCDTGNECVKFISLKENTFKTIGRGRLHMPFDCVCHKGKVFVSDSNAHLIKVYNANGTFLYEFGRYGTGDGELNLPTGLAVDKAGHLLVCSRGNHRVQVFTLDGEFVTKFAERGIELGQFERPTSVSILKSGHLVICEFGNHRLQIFE